VCSQSPARPSTQDCPVVHWTVSGALGWSPVKWMLSGIDDGVRLKITGLSRGAPDCPVSHLRRTRRSREKDQRCMAKIHRTVRWCTGLSGEPTVGHAVFARHMDCSNGQLVHRTVSGAPISLEEQWSDMPNLEGDRAPDSLQDLSGGAPDCPVRHSTEGRNCLPSWPPTAPSCLGAIKGTLGV
jgi:hypothetical protein